MLQWLSRVFGILKVRNQLSAIDRTVQRLSRERQQSEERLEQHRARIQQAQQLMDEEVKGLKREIDRCNGLNKKLEMALETARQEIEFFEQVTVPGLVAANKVMQDRWENESKILAVRTALVQNQSKMDL